MGMNAPPCVDGEDLLAHENTLGNMDAFGSRNITSNAPMSQSSQPYILTRTLCKNSGTHRVYWTVDARKLNGSSRTAVSPAFEIVAGGPLAFKMILSPVVAYEGKGGASFKKSKGRGTIQLKCEADMKSCGGSLVTFMIAVGKSREDVRKEELRGPVTHDFVAQNGLCGLPKGQETWDFNQFVDTPSQTFVICLEILRNIHYATLGGPASPT